MCNPNSIPLLPHILLQEIHHPPFTQVDISTSCESTSPSPVYELPHGLLPLRVVGRTTYTSLDTLHFHIFDAFVSQAITWYSFVEECLFFYCLTIDQCILQKC